MAQGYHARRKFPPPIGQAILLGDMKSGLCKINGRPALPTGTGLPRWARHRHRRPSAASRVSSAYPHPPIKGQPTTPKSLALLCWRALHVAFLAWALRGTYRVRGETLAYTLTPTPCQSKPLGGATSYVFTPIGSLILIPTCVATLERGSKRAGRHVARLYTGIIRSR
jgi:hypothetical protein